MSRSISKLQVSQTLEENLEVYFMRENRITTPQSPEHDVEETLAKVWEATQRR